MWMEEHTGKQVNVERSQELLATGATRIATACPFCYIMIDDGVKGEGADEDTVKVGDIAMHLLEALERGDRDGPLVPSMLSAPPTHGETAVAIAPARSATQTLVAEPEPEPEPAADPVAGPPDDLQLIKGIGPKLESWLYGKGITTFEQVAALTQDEVDALETEQPFPDRIDREDWRGQAARLAAEKSTPDD